MNSEQTDVTRQSIMALVRAGQLSEARELCLALCSRDQTSHVAWLLLGAVQLKLGDVNGAETSGRTATRLNPDDPEARNLLAEVLFLQGKLADSAEQYRYAVAKAPTAIPPLIGLGNACMALHNYHEAVDSYRRVLSMDTANGVVHHNLAEAYQNLSRLKEAEASYLVAVRLCPGRAEPHVNLGRVLQKLGRLQDAVDSQRRALDIDPHCSAAYYNIGLCLYDDRNPEPALQAFRRAVELNPSNLLTHCFLAILCSQHGDESLAAPHLEVVRQSSFVASIFDSWQYAVRANPSARFFSTTSQVLNYAIDAAGDDGLYLKFGVSYGASISMIAARVDGHVHGFDSFEGLPESWETGIGAASAMEQAGAYSTRGTLPPVPDNVVLHVGVFEDSLSEFVLQYSDTVNFINMDCDLYSSTQTVFRFLGARIRPGSVIVFDEYFCYPEWRQHEYKAFQEFILQRKVTYEYLAFSFFTGQAAVRILSVG